MFKRIKQNLSCYDRIFYWPNGNSGEGALLLFSKQMQRFECMNLDGQIKPFHIEAGNEYQQVELYDNKLFCVNRKSLILEIFFPSKKKDFFHKRKIYLLNKDVALKENFCLTIWQHHEFGILYRCLLGPLEDGRYMNFDLPERYFCIESNEEQSIGKIFFISMEPENGKNIQQDIVYAFNEENKSIICFDKNTTTFFEYNDFAGKETVSLEVVFDTILRNKCVKRMYFYYPYDYFSQKQKNQLKASVKGMVLENDLNIFVRNRYKEVLLCVEGFGLIKMSLMETIPLEIVDRIWKLNVISESKSYAPVDITLNKNTGEIYCLCEQHIEIIPNSGTEPILMNEHLYKRKRDYYSFDEFT